jgi:GTP cyclohydrolase I
MLLEGLGIDWQRDHNFIDTPQRVAKFYAEFFGKPVQEPKWFAEKHNQMIVLRHHQAWTLCPHHLLPVELDISAAYIPSGNVLGISKMVRLMDRSLDRPRTQEQITDMIADALMKGQVRGAACRTAGKHGCMLIRGVRTRSDVVMTALRGIFSPDMGPKFRPDIKQEFFDLVRS